MGGRKVKKVKYIFQLKLEKIVSFSLSLCCYAGCIFMVAVLFGEYNENQDSSSVTMKQFNNAPGGRNPSFTFCIYANDGKLFKDKLLQNDYDMSQKAYYQQLTGDRDAANTRLKNTEMDKVIIALDDILQEFEVGDFSFQKYNKWTPTMAPNTPPPLRQSYRDPGNNCFTYDTLDSRSVSLRKLQVKLNITKLQLIILSMTDND